MDNFLQQFKDNLENQPLPDFDANDWNAMQRKLDATPVPPASNHRKIWWALAAILLLSLFSNGMIFRELQKSNKKNSFLSQQKDTIIQKEIHYKTDTIYQIIYADAPNESVGNTQKAFAQNASNSAPLFQAKSSAFYFPPSSFLEASSVLDQFNLDQFKNAASTQPLLGLFTQQYANNQKLIAAKEEAEKEALLIEWQSRTPQILAARYSEIEYNAFPNLPDLNAVPAETNQKKTLVQRLYPLRPKSLAVGGQIGQTYFLNASKAQDYSLNLNVSFSDNLQMWVGGQYLSMGFESDGFNENQGIPVENPPNDDFDLSEIKVKRNGLQVDVGMQYFFNVQRKLQPFVGLGFGVNHLLKNEVKYEFENEQTDDEWEITRPLGQGYRNFAVFKAGLSYQVFPRWSGRLEGVYRQNINNPDRQVPNNIGLRLGVFYDFGKK